MITLEELRRGIQKKFNRFEQARWWVPAFLGDGSGNLEVSGRINYVYIRTRETQAIGQAFNNRVPLIDDLPIIVGYDRLQPALYQVLSVRDVFPGSGEIVPVGVPAHHVTHEFGNPTGGYDTVWVQQQQFVPLMTLPTSPASMQVQVKAGVYGHGNGWAQFDTTTSADFSTYLPSDPDTARFVLMSIDVDTNLLQYDQGDIFTLLSSLDAYEQMPIALIRSVALSAILLTDSTTSLVWDNIFGLRTLNYSVRDSTPALHVLAALESQIDYAMSSHVVGG